MVLARATVTLQRLSAHTRYSTRPLAAPHAPFSVQSREFLRYLSIRGPMHRLTATVNTTVASVPLAEVRTRSFGSFAGAVSAERFRVKPFCSSCYTPSSHISVDPAMKQSTLRCFSSSAQSAQAPLCSKLAEHGNVIIRDPEELERKKSAMRAAGLNKIQVWIGSNTEIRP